MQFESSLTLLNSDTPFLLEKRIKLLEAIKEAGSISKAAKEVPMSYKTAWEAIDSINNLCPQLVVKKETGGKGGGGAILTQYGQNLLNTYLILQKEHSKFLASLTKLTDFDTGNLKQLQRFNMQISARNQISGIVEKIITSDVNANVVITPKSNHQLFANISKNAIETLDIKEGQEAIAIFKSNNVLISTDENIAISARNKIAGEISMITQDKTNSELIIDIGEGESIVSIITTGAVKKLELEVGKKVYAFIKSSDIMIGK